MRGRIGPTAPIHGKKVGLIGSLIDRRPSPTRCPHGQDDAFDGICHIDHIAAVWTVELAPEFEAELLALPPEVRIESLAQARAVEQFGPTSSRPRLDTLKGSKHANMKELRFDAAGGVSPLPSTSSGRRACW
ncbi:MAG: type II toxin-antitoxin system RelE/ParE family toxin [Acetobacteraceae bacterium]